MDTQKLISLIDRLQVYSRKRPVAYKLRVAALAALGYVYLFAVVLILLLLVFMIAAGSRFNFLAMKFSLVLLALAGVVLRAMWVTVPEPDGRELNYEDAPPLFELVKEVRRALRGPRVHRVLLSDEFNASIVQIPRLGMFGWSRNYLVVGLPLLTALAPEEFRSVLAHEFGHLSGNHGRFSAWIYQSRQTWIQILTQVEQERRYASFLFEWFLHWYAPFFNAYSFVLARAQEYEADTYSVELVGKKVAAQALIRTDARHLALTEQFWPALYRRANDEPQPPKDSFIKMLDGMRQSISRGNAEKWLLQTLWVKTGYDDSHPSVADRLVGMGYQEETLKSQPVIAELIETEVAETPSAAQFYLKEVPEAMLLSFNRLLGERIRPVWRERHEFIKQARQRLTALEEKGRTESLTEIELWERAGILAETQNPAAAVPTLKKLLEHNPDLVGVNFRLGATLLEEEDESGIQYLENAMRLNASTTINACELLYPFHLFRGREPEAEGYRIRAEQYIQKTKEYFDAAFKFTPNDRFEPHGLSTTEVAEIQNQLRHPRLAKAFLVRKVMGEELEPAIIFGVTLKFAWPGFHSQKVTDQILRELGASVEFSQPLLFVALERKDKFLYAIFDAIPGARIFPV